MAATRLSWVDQFASPDMGLILEMLDGHLRHCMHDGSGLCLAPIDIDWFNATQVDQ